MARGQSRYRRRSSPSPFGWISAKQSPPIPVGLRLDHAGAARHIRPPRASAAISPPARNTSIAASAASGFDVATMRVLGVDQRRPAGEMEIPHAKLLTFIVVICTMITWQMIRPRWAMAGGA